MIVLASHEVIQVSGGMKWQGNRESSNVIDMTYESSGWIGLSYQGGFNYSLINYSNEGRGYRTYANASM